MLEGVAWRSCGCPIPVCVLGQAGCSSEQSGLSAGVLSMAGGLELYHTKSSVIEWPGLEGTLKVI